MALASLSQPLAAAALALPTFTRVSTAMASGEPDAASIQPSISHDGNLAVFSSYATNLVAVAVTESPQVYAIPVVGGTAELASVNDAGEPANGYAQGASTSGTGRFVVFQSNASNLVSYSGAPRSQVFIRDRVAHTIELVSVNSDEIAGDSYSSDPGVSADGRFIVFWSQSTNLGGAPFSTVYLRDRQLGTTIMVPVPAPSGAKVYNQLPRISDDGSTVIFTSQTLDSNGSPYTSTRVMAYKTVSGVTSEISVTNDGLPAYGGMAESVGSGVSGDGRFVVFHSRASSLKTLPNLPDAQVYLRDTVASTTRLISSENSNRPYTSAFGTISDDGVIATYSSGLQSGTQVITQHNLETGQVTTLNDTGTFWGSEPLASQDASGRRVLFMTLASLNPADSGGADIYLASPSDSAAPIVVGASDQQANANGWSPLGTSITWTTTDPSPSSGLSTTPPPTIVSAEGANQVISSGQSCDVAGNCSNGTFTLSVDATPPDIAASTAQATQANSTWYNTSVEFTWSCADTLSGIQGACPAPSTVGGEGESLSVSVSISDRAGNTATATTAPVNIDRTAPTTVAAAPGGWTNHDLTVNLSATDNLSGVATTKYSVDGQAIRTGSTLTVAGQGTHTISYWSIDVAGNAEPPKSAVVRLDYDGPSVTPSVSPMPNNAGWNRSPVTVSTLCSDASSGIAFCSPPITLTLGGASQNVQVSGTDGAGNTSARTVTVSIDMAAPIVSIVGAQNLGTYSLAAAPTPSCVTSDVTSGVAVAAELSVSRSANGTFIATCAGALDAAGNLSPALSISFRVNPSEQSILALTYQFMDENNLRHPLIAKATAAVLLHANTCAYINGMKAFGLAGTLAAAQVAELSYWARVISPGCLT
jgi:hypothetical protein